MNIIGSHFIAAHKIWISVEAMQKHVFIRTNTHLILYTCNASVYILLYLPTIIPPKMVFGEHLKFKRISVVF